MTKKLCSSVWMGLLSGALMGIGSDDLDELMAELMARVRTAGNQLIRKKEPASFVGWKKVLEDVQIFIQNQFPDFIKPSLLDTPSKQLKAYYGKKESVSLSDLERLIADINRSKQAVDAKMREYVRDSNENIKKLANNAGTLAQFTLSMLLTAAEDFRQDLIAARSRSPAKKFFDDIAEKGKKFFGDTAEKIVEKTAVRRFTLLSDRIDALTALYGNDYETLMKDLQEFANKYAPAAVTNDQNIRAAVGKLSSQIPRSVKSVSIAAQQGAKAAREEAKKSFGDSVHPHELYARMWNRVEGLARGK